VRFGLRRGGDRRYLAVVVEDDGPGLPEGLAERLARERYSTKPGGAGTGLSTSMHLAERHGGVLAVANRAHGRGARVEINLPTMTE
jgi:signal transduction histidine kinase